MAGGGLSKDKLKRFAPLGVLVALVIAIVIVLSMSESPPEPIEAQQPAPEAKAAEPPRDIRQAMDKQGSKGSTASETEEPSAARDEDSPVPLAAGKKSADEKESADEASDGPEDLVAAMKKAQRAKKKGKK